MIKDVEYLMYISTIWISSFEKSLLRSRFILTFNCLFSWCLLFFNSLYILDTNPVSDVHLVNVPFSMLWTVSTQMILSLVCRNILFSWDLIYLLPVLPVPYSKSSFLWQKFKLYLYFLLSQIQDIRSYFPVLNLFGVDFCVEWETRIVLFFFMYSSSLNSIICWIYYHFFLVPFLLVCQKSGGCKYVYLD